ncbi:hypothetical protein ACFV2H_45895 [Streptomyces sp. NPDC059629]|uniref:hypothetical protein n=1 Tax=Streptomyces sp. NPDC059629 TaxID=3346889 RepID=UPI003692A246
MPWEADRSDILEGIGRADPYTRGYWDAQDARDRQLGRDARAVRDRYTETPRERQQRHLAVDRALALADSTSAVGDLRALPADNEGVAIGGGHSGTAIWDFLATHMADLRAAGVRTVYLQSIREDSYQTHIDA